MNNWGTKTTEAQLKTSNETIMIYDYTLICYSSLAIHKDRRSHTRFLAGTLLLYVIGILLKDYEILQYAVLDRNELFRG